MICQFCKKPLNNMKKDVVESNGLSIVKTLSCFFCNFKLEIVNDSYSNLKYIFYCKIKGLRLDFVYLYNAYDIIYNNCILKSSTIDRNELFPDKAKSLMIKSYKTRILI